MSDATIITIVTIVCAAVVTSVQYLTKRDVIQLHNTVDLQTKQLAILHQTIAGQYEKINTLMAERIAPIEKMGRAVHTEPPDQPYTANPPYRPPDARK
jgi:hypothetical protein